MRYSYQTLTILVFPLLLSSCDQKPKPLTYEKEIVKSITSAWGGQCSIERKMENYTTRDCSILVSIKQSPAIAKKKISAKQLTSNMAIRTYKLLTNEEVQQNARIKCIVVRDDDEQHNYIIIYNMQKVSTAVAGEGYFNYCANQFRSMEITTLFERFDTTLLSAATLAQSRSIMDSTSVRMRRAYGPSWSDSMFFFNYTTIQTKDKTPQSILNCFGYIFYEKKLVPFGVSVIPGRNYDETFLYSMTFNPL